MQRVVEVQWACDGCKSVIRFHEGKPMNCFAQGAMAGLLLAHHRSKCQGNHYENGNTSVPSLERSFLAAVEGKSWRAVLKEARGNQERDE